MYLYFDFIRYTTYTNLVLFALSSLSFYSPLTLSVLINIIPHFYYDGWANFQTSWFNIGLGGPVSQENITAIVPFRFISNKKDKFDAIQYGKRPCFVLWPQQLPLLVLVCYRREYLLGFLRVHFQLLADSHQACSLTQNALPF